MSFDVFLQHFERGEPAEADRATVAAVLRELGATGPDDFGHYHVLVSDLWKMVKGHSGPVAELEILGGPEAVPSPAHEPYRLAVSATGLDGEEGCSGCAFFLHAFSHGVAEVIFRIAEAGGMAIIPAAQIGPLLPPTADPGYLPGDMSQPHQIASGRELFSAPQRRLRTLREMARPGDRRRVQPPATAAETGQRHSWPWPAMAGEMSRQRPGS